MFASKVDGLANNVNAAANNPTPAFGGSYSTGAARANNHGMPPAPVVAASVNLDGSLEPQMRERKLSGGSGGNNSTVGMKSKWMKAFKSIKGKNEPPDEG